MKNPEGVKGDRDGFVLSREYLRLILFFRGPYVDVAAGVAVAAGVHVLPSLWIEDRRRISAGGTLGCRK